MKISEYNTLIYPKLEKWQEDTAKCYFKMGTGAWPDDLHGLIYRICKQYGMCGDVLWETIKMYVYLRTKDWINYYEITGNKIKNIPDARICKSNESIKESPPLELYPVGKLKDKVKNRWMNENESG